MARFRRQGLNWEGRPWRVPESIDALADEIEALDPRRWPADGTVASRNHDLNSPRSDHRPTPYVGAGVVRAIDFGGTTEHLADTAELLRIGHDSRIKYVIHNRRWFGSSGATPWEWRHYPGSPHTNHVHVSVLRSFDSDNSAWMIGGDVLRPGMGSARDPDADVMGLQKALNSVDGAGLVTDGIYGELTARAVREYQVRKGLRASGVANSWTISTLRSEGAVRRVVAWARRTLRR